MAAGTTSDPDPDRIDPKVLKRALILVVGFLGVIFDTTIVSVALHTLAAQLHTSVSAIQWVTTGYLLALGIAVPLSVWGLQRFGGKRLWMFGLTVFLVGSIGSSLAWDVGSLIAWRVVQGVGGGILFPLLTTLIMQAAGGKALGRTVTIIALPALLGPILGPLVGGAILTHFSWRFMFWVNVPFCAVGLFLAARHIPADTPDPAKPRPHLDLLGLAMLAPGIAAVILGLSNAGVAAGFAHPDVIVPLAIGVVLLAAFTCYALRRTAPLMDVRLLARRPVASASAVLFFSGFALYGAMLLLPLYYQEVRGFSPLTAGLMLAPQGVGALLSRNLAGRLTDKIGGRPIAVAGFVIVAASTIPFAFAGTSTNSWLLAFWLVVRGFALYGAMLLLPLYYQEVRGFSPLTAGIMLAPQGVGALLSRNLAGRLTDKIGGRPIAVAGFVIVAASTIPFAFAGTSTNSWLLAFWLVVRGFGLGAVTIPVMAVAFLGLDKQEIAQSSVLTRTAQQIGGSFGTAVLAVILSSAIAAHHGNLATGFDIAFWWATGFSAVAVLLSRWLPGSPRSRPQAPADPPPPARVTSGQSASR